jgi:2-polyprenyl-6-methoxyphenol hydroxylase-like FAD-dependent oxidoreductase
MRAIVVGGGIGGLCAGIALRRAGIDVDVFDRVHQIAEVGAGIQLTPNALAGLERLGVADAVRERAGTGAKRVVLTWRGTVLSEEPWHGVSLRRADLQDVLVEALGGEIELGSRCTGFVQDEGGATIAFAGGSTESADVVVGADGLHSQVRTQLFGAAKPVYVGTTVFRGVARFSHPSLVHNTETWGRGCRFGMQSLGRGRVYWFATANAPEGAQVTLGKRHEALFRRFRGWREPVELALERTDEDAIVQSDVYVRPPLPRWSFGRVTLLGDAAHPMAPDMAQGGAQAIEDAVFLAECLRGARDPVAALQAYEAERLPRANAVAARALRLHRLSQLQHPFSCAARNTAVRFLPNRLKRMAGIRRS